MKNGLRKTAEKGSAALYKRKSAKQGLRSRIFRRVLRCLEGNDSAAVRAMEILILRGLAAKAFRRPAGWSLTEAASLGSYADYTAACMRSGDCDEARLYDSALRLGRRIRRVTGLRDRDELSRLIEYLYRNIGIRMRWTDDDEMLVEECFFAGVYSSEECRLMSNFDSGITGGILGGGKLVFTERLTEGCGRCRACLKGDES